MNYYVDNIGTPKTSNLSSYRKAKIKILSRDFEIDLTLDEITEINKLKSEIAIDNYCVGIINKRWG